jgi:tRNA(fMet)-specific endonuclease VapC
VRYLVDSDWVADYLKGYQAAVRLLYRLAPEGMAVSLVTFAEITEGILYGADQAANRQAFRQFLHGVKVLPLNRTVLTRFATVRGQLRQQHAPVQHRAFDLLIAATALTYDLELVTRNVRDFADVPGLKLYSG